MDTRSLFALFCFKREMDMNTVFDELLLGHANKFEGKLEKKLREVGEMFVDRTESKLRSSGKFSFSFLKWYW